MNSTVVRLSARSLFGRRRGILLFVLPLVLIAVAVLMAYVGGTSESTTRVTLDALGLQIVVPLVALVAATGVLAPEIDDGSIVYLLAKPVSRYRIVISKFAVVVLSVAVFGALAMLIASLILSGAADLSVGFAVGSLAAGATYSAVFCWLSVWSRHAVVFGLIYLVLWEGLLGGLLDGIRWLSVARWGKSVAWEIGVGSPDPSLAYALIACAVVIVAAGWLAGNRLRSFNLTGED